MKSSATQKGFSLVEVLTALFILAVGILGIIALQLFAKQNNFDAIQRSTAAALATDIAERMRMNKSTLASYVSAAVPVPLGTPVPDTCGSSASPCAPAEVAAHDLATWYALIAGAGDQTIDGVNVGGLPEASACIVQNPFGVAPTIGEKEYRIVIAWRGRTPMSNPVASNCGEDPTGARYGTDNAYRRIYLLDAKIE